MSSLTRLGAFDWYKFLRQWSRDLLSNAKYANQLPTEVKESGWLGFPGATEEQIIQAEARLNVILPPSYREFLKVSNGWRQTTPFIYRIWSIDQVEWFHKKHEAWIKVFTETHLGIQQEHLHKHHLNGSTHFPEIPDAEYYIYGEEQDCSKFRLTYLNSALEISEKGESAIYLLNPEVIAENGEWEAWFFGDWLPGVDRYRSFQEMMEAEYENFLEMTEVS